MVPQAGKLVHPDLPDPFSLLRRFLGCFEHSPSTFLLPEQAQPGRAQQQESERADSLLNTQGLLETESMRPQEHIQQLSAPSLVLQGASRQENKQQGQKKTFFTSIPRKVIDTHTD